MATSSLPEHWLRGPLPGISPVLQPVAHALLQARDEVTNITADFPDHLLWERPAGLASVGFHLQHLRGVLDRLFTYADGQQLTAEQLAFLKSEGLSTDDVRVAELVSAFQLQVDQSIAALKRKDEKSQKPSRARRFTIHVAPLLK